MDNTATKKRVKRTRNARINSFILEALKNEFVMEQMEALRTFDKYTFKHSINVASESISIGMQFHLNDKQLLDLTYAALMHDIGKIEVGIDIIGKQGKLTEDEIAAIKLHPITGAKKVRESHLFSSDVVNAILMHHENYDGTGYFGVSEYGISLYAKIIRIADTFDAMTDKRPYHEAKPEDVVIDTMTSFSDFDPHIFGTFQELKVPSKGKNSLKILLDT